MKDPLFQIHLQTKHSIAMHIILVVPKDIIILQ